MSALIKEFMSEHSKIIKVLSEVEEFGILTKGGQAKLMSAKATLNKHLKKEKEKLYPVLLRKAEQNKKLQEGLEVFEKDLKSVSRFVLEFYSGFDKGVLGARLLKEFQILLMVLRNRMWNEENYLYVEYEEMSKL